MPKVLYDKRGEIAYITLNRPEKRNAIDTETDDLLFDAWTDFRDAPAVRLAIGTPAGVKWLCAGGALAFDIRVAADDIQFGFFDMRRGMHFGDGGIVRLVNPCGVGIAMELEL